MKGVDKFIKNVPSFLSKYEGEFIVGGIVASVLLLAATVGVNQTETIKEDNNETETTEWICPKSFCGAQTCCPNNFVMRRCCRCCGNYGAYCQGNTKGDATD